MSDFIMDYPKAGRGKVPPGTGFSMTDWTRLCMSARKPTERKISQGEIRMHNRPDDMWMVINGKVYDITLFAKYHPGGVNVLLPCAGKDATIMFNKYHAYINVEAMMGPFCFGRYDPTIKFDLPPSYFGLKTEKSTFAKSSGGFGGSTASTPKPWKKGEPLTVDIISSRCTKDALWVIIYGKVYDVTDFQKKHPGGPDFLLQNGGKDCSAEFDKYHSQAARAQLVDYYIGDVKKSVSSLLTPTSTAPPTRKPKPKPALNRLTLKNKKNVSHNTCMLTFTHTLPSIDVPLCGHVRLHSEDGYSRSYTPIKTTPEELTFVIKSYSEGKVSKHVCELQLETTVGMTGPMKSAFSMNDSHDCYVLVAGGTGIAPFYPLLQLLLKRDIPAWVVCCNTTSEDVLLPLDDFPNATVLHHFSKDSGHITKPILESFLPGTSPTATSLVCGPPVFNTTLSGHLAELGYDVTILE
eukprot:TRINITY_DN2669_c3_g1_i1.p1 TRINITY_DN2669_c3_g1~~TRINITY_DN2669_c3_g1_i1.p1  ORF type:complete len:465 (+),score=73.59 TRINITY_DN2669_c3_g1_i1:64-1458(+)